MMKARFFIFALIATLCVGKAFAQASEPGQASFDLARQLELTEQVQQLAVALEELAKLPPNLSAILLDNSKTNVERLREAVAILTSEATAPENVSDAEATASENISNSAFTPPPSPFLFTPDDIWPQVKDVVFVEVTNSAQHINGMVMFSFDGEVYRGGPGESFKIGSSQYTVSNISYVGEHALEIEVQTPTKLAIITIEG